MSQDKRISVVGLGKLGAAMAAAIASRGIEVIGTDCSEEAVAALNEGCAPVRETDLDALISDNRSRLKATTDTAAAVRDSDIVFIIVPTPSDDCGGFALDYAEAACRDVGRGLADKAGYQLVVMTSTVLPGACRDVLVPALEAASGRTAGRDFGFCYSPEFIALGSVIRDFLNPDLTLVGEWDRRSGAYLEAMYEEILASPAPCRRMTLENAELAKIALNSYVTMKITFANTLAEICSRMPGGDVDAVTQAIGSDHRIGANYLKGGIGFGGPCFPRDNVAFDVAARRCGIDAGLAIQTDRLNRSWLDNHLERIVATTTRGARVAVLGLSYKPSSSVIEESQGLELAKRLAGQGFDVVGFDPLANALAQSACGGTFELADSLANALEKARCVVITAPDAAFRELGPEDLDLGGGMVCVYDLWRCCKARLGDHPGVLYRGYGLNPGDALEDSAEMPVATGAAE